MAVILRHCDSRALLERERERESPRASSWIIQANSITSFMPNKRGPWPKLIVVCITAFWPWDGVAKMTARRVSSQRSIVVIAARIHGSASFQESNT